MPNRLRIFTALLLFSLAAILAADEKTAPQFWPIEIKGTLFPKMELALDAPSRTKGLMHRSTLPDDGGMLFLFKEEDMHSFWMRNTLIPLDILFVNAKGIVTAVHTMPVEPRKPGEDDGDYCARLKSYSSKTKAIAAIELNAGMAKALDIKPGDTIRLFREQLAKWVQ